MRLRSLLKITCPLGVVFQIVTFIHQSWTISWCVLKLAGKWRWILFQDQSFLCWQFKHEVILGVFVHCILSTWAFESFFSAWEIKWNSSCIFCFSRLFAGCRNSTTICHLLPTSLSFSRKNSLSISFPRLMISLWNPTAFVSLPFLFSLDPKLELCQPSEQTSERLKQCNVMITLCMKPLLS